MYSVLLRVGLTKEEVFWHRHFSLDCTVETIFVKYAVHGMYRILNLHLLKVILVVRKLYFFLFSLKIGSSSTFCDFAVHVGCFETCTVNFHVLLKWWEEEEECPCTPFGL